MRVGAGWAAGGLGGRKCRVAVLVGGVIEKGWGGRGGRLEAESVP